MNTLYFLAGIIATIILSLAYILFSTRGYDPADDIARTIKHDKPN